MKKSNKGFTLVELLAAIVIMGILLLFAVPTIVNMVFNNRNKMYITDAKKLVSQVEYRIKASSSTIQKPAPGNAIIVSMMYLNEDEFDVAPNRGKYVKDASYVIVKNNNGSLEYTVSLVEQMASGKNNVYRGIELVKSAELSRSNAVSHVKTIPEKDLKRVDKNIDSSSVAYINEYFKKENKYNGNYISKITRIYNKPELRDSASKSGLESPIINKVTMISTSGKKYNSLDATLTVNAEDKDTPSNKLTVYVSIGSPVTSSTKGFEYGNENVFTKEYDLSKKYNYKDGGKAVIYVVVKDSDGNMAEKKLDYQIHTNEEPVILDSSTMTKLPNDKKNLTTALFRLDVEDDIDTDGGLEVCYTTDINANSCGNYKKYTDEFSNNVKNYSFEPNKCSLDGQTKSIKVFVRDSLGRYTSKVFNYTIHKNEAPTIENVTIKSAAEPFTTTGSLDISIKVKGSDDVSSDSKLKVKVEGGGINKEYDYSPDEVKEFTLSGKYDGSKKKIKVTLIDECGENSSITKEYTVYNNQAPIIEKFSLSASDYACKNEDDCPMNVSGNGNFKANVELDINDDIDYGDLGKNISVCVSENINECNLDGNFINYSTYSKGFEHDFSKSSKNKYDGSTKTLYVVAKDSSGEKRSTSATYKLYTNKPPKINEVNITSKSTSFTSEGDLNTKIYLDVEDDIDDLSKIRYIITDGVSKVEGDLKNYYKSVTLEDEEGNKFEDQEEQGVDFKFAGDYDGKDRNLTVTIYDSYNTLTKSSKTYKVYENQPPEIKSIQISPKSDECPVNYKCPYSTETISNIVESDIKDEEVEADEEGEDSSESIEEETKPFAGGKDVIVNFVAIDDIDSARETTEEGDEENAELTTDPNLLVCVSDLESFCKDKSNFIKYSEFEKRGNLFEFNKGVKPNPYDGSEKTLYVVVMDSSGKTAQDSLKYKLYQNQPPTIITSANPDSANPEETDVTYPRIVSTSEDGKNISKAKFEILADDDFEDSNNLFVNICYKEGTNGSEKCFGNKPYQDEYTIDFGVTKYTGQKFYVHAIVTDSFGATTTTKPIEYQLYKDAVPEIREVEAVIDDNVGTEVDPNSKVCKYDSQTEKYYDKNGNETTEENYLKECYTGPSCKQIDEEYYDNEGNEVSQSEYNAKCIGKVVYSSTTTTDDKLKVSFVVSDPYDTYKVCISESNSGCSTYYGKENGEGFDGTSLKSNLLYFTVPKGIKYDKQSKTTMDAYYLYVKDSNDNLGVYKILNEEGQVLEEQNYHSFSGKLYESCKNVETIADKIEYTFQSGTKISAEACGGKCYYATQEDISKQLSEVDQEAGETLDPVEALEINIQKAYYQRKISYKDKFDSTKSCPSDEVDDNIEKDCSFRECFYNEKKKSYNTKAIGLKKKVMPRDEVITINDGNGNVYESQYYFQIYLGDYDMNSDRMIFNPTNYKVTSEAYLADNSIYKYNKNAEDFYVRIRD